MTIAAGKQVIALAKGTTTVYLGVQKVEEILSDGSSKIPRPLTKVNQDIKNPGTLIIGLKTINHVFNVTGFLDASAESGNYGLSWSGGTISNADDARKALIKDIIYRGGDIEMHYRNYKDSDYGEYYGTGSTGASTTYVKTYLDKISFIDASTRADDGSTLVHRYLVQLALTRGVVR